MTPSHDELERGPEGGSGGDADGGSDAASERRRARLQQALAEEVRRKIAGGEGTRTEFKRSFSTREKLARTFAAFANGDGGVLLIGVEDDGAVCGAPDDGELESQLADTATNAVVPPVRTVALGLVLDVADDGRLERRRVLAVFVPRSDAAPHRAPAHDGTYKAMLRRAASTREVSEEQIARVLAQREPLDADEHDVVAVLAEATRAERFENTTAGKVEFATGLARSRVRRALHKLERGGWCLGLGDAPEARLHLVWS